jgi:hypothetical protein
MAPRCTPAASARTSSPCFTDVVLMAPRCTPAALSRSSSSRLAGAMEMALRRMVDGAGLFAGSPHVVVGGIV